jgi:IS30 family transposase
MYHHLSKEERDQIAIWHAQALSLTEIGRRLGRDKSTISRELRRNADKKEGYKAIKAQEKSVQRWQKSHQRMRLKSKQIQEYVISKIKQGWTPEIISGRLSVEYPGLKTNHESIYQFIYSERRDLGLFLPRKHVKRKPKLAMRKSQKTKIPNRIPLKLRPEKANKREEFGHYEADFIVSRQSKVALCVITERVSRYTFILKTSSKSAKEASNAIISALHSYPVHSITYDNGTEFTCHELVNEILETKSFFCEPYHSWEKGTVENRNGLIRRYYPKKTDFKLVDPKHIRAVQDQINNRPMTCLGYNTPREIFLKNLSVALAA